MTEKLINQFNNLFYPKSIAIIGASNDHGKPGGRLINNIIRCRYKGILWAVNPRTDSIANIPTFKTESMLPNAPDLAIIAIPAPLVRASIENLAQVGTKAAIILSAGFGELNDHGKSEELKILSIANSNNMTIVGPNCSGFLTPTYAGKFAGIIPELTAGTIDFVSGSGATVDYFMEQAIPRGLKFGNVVNMGNSVQMGIEDIMALLDVGFEPDSAKLKLLYIESIKNPAKLLQHAASLTQKGATIVAIKSGVTDAGQRAALSHTGAMASPDHAVQALFNKAGIIRVDSKADMIDVACIYTAANRPINGKNVCIITDAGGPGVMLADKLNLNGFSVPPLKELTRKKLAEILPAESSLGNPIDCLPSRTAEQISQTIEIIEQNESENINLITVITGNAGLVNNGTVYQAIGHSMDACSIPIVPVLSSRISCAEMINEFILHGYTYFSDEVNIALAANKLVYRPKCHYQQKHSYDLSHSLLSKHFTNKSGPMMREAMNNLLMAAGFRLPRELPIGHLESLAGACQKIGFPLVMKVDGHLHKTDVGGVIVGITNFEEAKQAFDSLIRIKGSVGVIVQNMVSGPEIIIGAKKIQDYGHLIMFGIGGIYTEILKDVSFGLAPLSDSECECMMARVKALPILKGIRNEKGISMKCLVNYIKTVSQLVTLFPQIEEIDFNPVKGTGEELYIVDARVILNG